MRAVTIRPAVMNDAPVLQQLIEASVTGLGSVQYSAAEIQGALGHALGLDTQLIEDGTYFVAELPDKTTVACGGWSWRQKLCGSDSLDTATSCGGNETEGSAKIRAIFVHPDWARRGLGSLILQHVENEAKAAGFRHLEMGSTLSGVALYRLRGYRETERMGIPLPNGETLAIVRMVKEV